MLSCFITDRFIALAVNAQLPTVERATNAFAMGVIPQQSISIRDSLGQPTDTDYDNFVPDQPGSR